MAVRSRPGSRLFFLLGIVMIGLAVFLGRPWIERSLQFVERPAVGVGTWLYRNMVFFKGSSASPEEVQNLKDQVLSLAVDQVLLDRLKKENKELKTAVDFEKRSQRSTITASVILRSSTVKSALFVVDRGARDGIHVEDPVIVGDGVLVGKVSALTPTTATITALTDPGSATAVSILNQNQTIGIAEGITGNLLRLKFIPQGTDVAVNQLVTTSGLESRIPSGLLVGLVNDVKSEQNAPFLEAIVEPLIDVRTYEIVQVITGPSL
ncbi:rod shape-determining protein MreC [Candidatus Uhrbacteria bacterium]|nr:rod shape-determining protein MreC [Candidatus Uhrbacteria bacterium]